MSLRGLSEAKILGAIVPLLPAGDATLIPSGDDAAVLTAPDGRYVISTDVLVDGSHFRRDWSGPRAVGQRAAAQNLADIAAMGARPTAMVVGMTLPIELELTWLQDFARGLADRCAPLGVGVVGGDITRADALTITVTVCGDLEGRAPHLRSAARPGDAIALAGTLGYSAAGLALLAGNHVNPQQPIPEAFAPFVDIYRAPRPPLEAALAAAASPALNALMDVSDGLGEDAGRIAKASGVRLDFDGAALDALAAPLQETARVCGADARGWVVTGGEDHAFLATFAPGAPLPEGFRALGTVRPGSGVSIGGVEIDPAASGWDHFA